MSLRFASEQLADLRRDAQLLVERALDQEGQLDAFVTATERICGMRRLPSHMQRTTSTWMRSDTCFPHNSSEPQRARQPPNASWSARTNSTRRHVGLLAHLDGARSAGAQCPNGVLVVDDYGDVREVVARVLEDAGFAVRTAANGLEALIAAL